MSDERSLTKRRSEKNEMYNSRNNEILSYQELNDKYAEASRLVDDIVLKNYVYNLTNLEVIPLSDELKDISNIRIFKITEMVYQKDEYSTYKFASVFSAVQNLNCGIFIIINSDGEKADFYMGVRSLDTEHTTKSLKDTLRNALIGQFPGVKTKDLLDDEAEKILSDVPRRNLAVVSCVGKNKDEELDDNKSFIQGLEKFVLAMQGQVYTSIILAKSISTDQLEETRKAYETVYTQLSPFTNIQLSYGTNTALSVSDALSHGISKGRSYSENFSEGYSESYSKGISRTHSVTKTDKLGALTKAVGTAAVGVAGIATAPLTGGASLAAAGILAAAQAGISSIQPSSESDGETEMENENRTDSKSKGFGFNKSESETNTSSKTRGVTTSASNNTQLIIQNKTLLNTLERIEYQLKRIDECESIGMWECAAYFLSDIQETAEMAASTYKALMKGEKSGVEASAINFWGMGNNNQSDQLEVLRDYIVNFIHPVFEYKSKTTFIPVTAASRISSNELAILMGLPRKSVCGFPVIEHADFGKEVVRYTSKSGRKNFYLGKIFSMGKETNTEVNLDIDSLTMHTFITGSTGSGKSNAVYEILDQIGNLYRIPFLVIEPAKGEYKNIFGQFPDITVYSTNPQKAELLKINPFMFPKDIHVLEHLDRLVEIFNVCWPMYAAMPAILKEAIERAYVSVGWDLVTSENTKGEYYPNFADVFEKTSEIINESKYSDESKGDYSGALLTRLKSLTTGLNKLIFCGGGIKDEDMFGKNVIVDLSRVGSVETKALVMGLLVMKLNEYRMSIKTINNPLRHITVLEEAHNLLRSTSTEQISEGSNVLGKSVELLSNSIAEMRTYGEGFIIADQSPGLLDMSVIRNTNTKIILRLPEKSDRELVGYSAGLKEDQIDELSKLGQGVAAVYQNDWIEPVLVKICKCDIKEKYYDYDSGLIEDQVLKIKIQLINFLLQKRVEKPLEYNLDEIEKKLDCIGLSSVNIEYIKELLTEYKQKGEIELWKNNQFENLAKLITDIIDARSRVENCVLIAKDNDQLTDMLDSFIERSLFEVSDEIKLAIEHCFMKDMSVQRDETGIKEKLYMQWAEYIWKGRMRRI